MEEDTAKKTVNRNMVEEEETYVVKIYVMLKKRGRKKVANETVRKSYITIKVEALDCRET